MKHCWTIVFLLQFAVLAHGRQIPQPPARFVTISLPQSVNPETVEIHVGIYGQGFLLTGIQTRSGVHDYPIDVGNSDVGPAQSLKLLIYIPGYRMVASEFKGSEIEAGMVFTPPLVSLPTVEVKGRLLNTAEEPVVDQALSVVYPLSEAMRYFGYLDGMSPILSIGSGRTDSNGEFTIDVPSVLDDPFFQMNATPIAGRFLFGGRFSADYTLSPDGFPAQRTYESLVVRKTQMGVVSGKLGERFLLQHNLSTDLSVYVRPRDPIVSGIKLTPMPLPPAP